MSGSGDSYSCTPYHGLTTLPIKRVIFSNMWILGLEELFFLVRKFVVGLGLGTYYILFCIPFYLWHTGLGILAMGGGGGGGGHTFFSRMDFF